MQRRIRVSTKFPLGERCWQEEEIKWKRISTKFPLRNTSKDFIEVLCLGLEGTNPRISRFAIVGMQINLVIEPLTLGLRILGFRGGGGDDQARYTELVVGSGLTLGRQSYLNGTKLAAADIIEDGIQASACYLDNAVRVI